MTMTPPKFEPLLETEHLCYQINGRPLLKNIHFSIHAGDCIALMGGNGAGKSTLLRLLLGLLSPASGTVLLDGTPQAQMTRRAIARWIAYLPQQHSPSFPFSVYQIVLQGRLPLHGLGHAPKRADRDAVWQALIDTGIEDFAERCYTELSGGERQLVLIARALAQQARIILLDEPETGLDYGHQLRLLTRLKQLAEQGYAIVLTTHRPDLALLVANRALILHQGQLIADGHPAAVIDAPLIHRLYQVNVEQISHNGYQFFFPAKSQ